jgi:hypothetical protein
MAVKPEIVAGTDEAEKLDFAEVADTTLPPDPFNPEALRLPPDFEQRVGVNKVLNIIPVRKPNDQEWFDVCPDPVYRGDYAAIKLKADGEFYIVAGNLVHTLADEIIHVTIYTVMTKSGVLLLWPIKIPSASDRRQDKWTTSAHEAALKGMERRVRMKSNREGGFYEIFTSKSTLASEGPVWPTEPFFELLRIGFAKDGRFIADLNHPVLKLLHEGG